MKVKQLLKLCGEMANLNVETDSEIIEEGQCGLAKQLLNCCNFVLEELYRDYASSVRRTVLEVKDGFGDTSSYRLCKVLSLVDKEGNDVRYRYTEGGLSVDEDGQYNLCYARLPNEVDFDDEVMLPTPRITERILAYGILREYFTVIGDKFTATQWEEKYKDALRIAEVKTSSMHMPVGRWL